MDDIKWHRPGDNLITLKIHKKLGELLKEPANTIFLSLLRWIYTEASPVRTGLYTTQEAKKNNIKQIKGRYWEAFCQIYLSTMYDLDVYHISDLPDNICKRLKLTKRDVGIDLIAVSKDKLYYAIQCKYFSPNMVKRRVKGRIIFTRPKVPWQKLSTFLSLAQNSGPYEQYIVMTPGSGVTKSKGVPRIKERLDISFKDFESLCRVEWIDIYNYHQSSDVIPKVISKQEKIKTIEELRDARIRYFDSH